MRRWLRWLGSHALPGRRPERLMREAEPIRIGDVSREVTGQWIALRGHEVVEVRATLDQLMRALADRCIDDVTVMRAPAEGEAELVGLG